MRRSVEVVITALALIILLPVMGVVALLVRLRFGRPVLFRQIRPGLHGAPFTIYKFRSMRDLRDAHGNLLPDEQRLTRFGNLLRASSLDELPELFNVLRGDMSLVGPRPLLMRYLPRYTPEQARRNEVRPGITGLAQVRGRNAISWDEKFALDVYYVDHRSFWLDCRILAWTVLNVVRRDGISAEGHTSSPEFMGSPELMGTVCPDDSDVREAMSDA